VPDGPLGEAILSIALPNGDYLTIRPEFDSDRLWFQEEGASRPLLLLAEEPQVCPVGRPLRFLVLAGLLEDLPTDVRIVRMRFGDGGQWIQAKTSERAWILLVPVDEIRQDPHLNGDLVWHRLSGEPYQRRALRSLRGFATGSGADFSERQGTAYGPPIRQVDLPDHD
jgi:hypothetical protein